MKGFLPLLFLCVTLYLVEGEFYNRPLQGDPYHESDPHMDRGDWISFRDGLALLLGQNLRDTSEGSLRTIRKPVWEGPVIFLADDIEDSGEDRSPSVESGAGFRHPSTSYGLGATFRHPENTIPPYQFAISSRSDPKPEYCYVRQGINLFHLMVANTYEEATSINGVKTSSPKMLGIMVRELLENLDSVRGIRRLDREFLKHVKIIRIIFRLLRKTFSEHGSEGFEMTLALAFCTQAELILQDFLDLAAEDTRDKAPGIRLLLDVMDTILADLNEEKEAHWKKYITHLPEVQQFVDDARASLEALIKTYFHLKRNSKLRGYVLREILVYIQDIMGEVIADHLLFDITPGSADNFLRQLLIEIQKAISRFLEDTSF